MRLLSSRTWQCVGIWCKNCVYAVTDINIYPPAIRRVISTTNAIASLHYTLRKRRKARGVFPNDESMVQLLYLALYHVAKRWPRPMRDWKAALHQLVILFGKREPV
jgi:putative transposase